MLRVVGTLCCAWVALVTARRQHWHWGQQPRVVFFSEECEGFRGACVVPLFWHFHGEKLAPTGRGDHPMTESAPLAGCRALKAQR